MKTILFILVNSLFTFMQAAVYLCESFMSHFGLIRWAYNRDPNTSNENGSIGRWVFFRRYGKSLVRGRASRMKIKDIIKFSF